MKAILTYEFNEEDKDRMRTILHAENYRYVLHEFWQDVLRPVTKHGLGCEDDASKLRHYEDIQEELFRLVREYDVEIW